MMYLTKTCLSFLNRRAVGIFKMLSITKVANIIDSLSGIGKRFHYSLSFSFYYSLCTEFRNTCTKFFLYINIVLDIYRLHFINVNDVLCLSLLSNEINTCIFYDNDNDTIETYISFAVMEDKTIVDQKIYNLKHQVADNISKAFCCWIS